MLGVFSPNMERSVGSGRLFVFFRGLLGFCGIAIKNRSWKEGKVLARSNGNILQES